MRGEREKEKEKNDEEESLDHFYHRHPLTLSEVGWRSGRCDGCRRYIYPGEIAYVCRENCSYPILHEECAEMPREIRLALHPQHTLIQKEVMYIPKCAVCGTSIICIGYYCATSDRCGFQVHVGCAQDIGVLQSCIDHPSHPHQLTLLWRPGRSCLSRCDACGTIEKGNSYICIICQYWIHESCAKLSTTEIYQHRNHPLSLVYRLPQEYIKFNFKCDICYKALLPRYWAYHCEICRYVVHIKCATKMSLDKTINVDGDADAAEDKDLVVFPTINTVEELIGPFVTRSGVMSNTNEIFSDKYKFNNHDHDLRLMSSSLHDQQQEKEEVGEEEEEEDENSDDDDDLNYDQSQLLCDGCTMPMFSKNKKSSDKYCNYYMSCGECKYFLHWSCFNIPLQIPSHLLHPQLGHNLSLQSRSKLDFVYCTICGIYTNGLFYGCTMCEFKVDIKCASLPNTIKHKAHRRHPLKLLNKETTRNDNYWERLCGACDRNTYGYACYICDVCEIILHSSCALLPAVVTNRAWDKHPLPLTFDASLNHPGSFYCDVCEQEMNPKRWMYHCRTCDLSVHPNCFPTASGEYQNIKFGQRYLVPSVHNHPIAYQLLTTKLCCDVCDLRKEYGCRGFQCALDKCDFFMCLHPCATMRRDDMRVVD